MAARVLWLARLCAPSECKMAGAATSAPHLRALTTRCAALRVAAAGRGVTSLPTVIFLRNTPSPEGSAATDQSAAAKRPLIPGAHPRGIHPRDPKLFI